MGSRLRLVAESFSNLPSALNTWEITQADRRVHHVGRIAITRKCTSWDVRKTISPSRRSMVMNRG
jgi:hypothetical protein